MLHRSFTLRGHEHHVEIGSTNDRAFELCTDPNLPVPFLIQADRQTSGRGRGTNRWWSGDGALMLSLIIDPSRYGLAESRWPQVSLTVGSAVCEALAQFATGRIGLKWPNDVWLNDRKVCGILVEIPPHSRSRLVIGIGLNVNNSFVAAPSDLQAIATSLFDESGRSMPHDDVLNELLEQLDTDLKRLAADDQTLADQWRRRCVLTGRRVTLDTGQEQVTGACLGIANDGALRLQPHQSERHFYGGIIRQITSC